MAFLHSVEPVLSSPLWIFYYEKDLLLTFVFLRKYFLYLIRSVFKYDHCLNGFICNIIKTYLSVLIATVLSDFKLWSQPVGDVKKMLENAFGQLIIHVFLGTNVFYLIRSWSCLFTLLEITSQQQRETDWKTFKYSPVVAHSSEVLLHTGVFHKIEGILTPSFCQYVYRVELEWLGPLCLWHKMPQIRLFVKAPRCFCLYTDVLRIWKTVIK